MHAGFLVSLNEKFYDLKSKNPNHRIKGQSDSAVRRKNLRASTMIRSGVASGMQGNKRLWAAISSTDRLKLSDREKSGIRLESAPYTF